MSANQNRTPISESQFQMWRCMIALAHSDGTVAPQEKAYLDRVIASLDRVYGLSPAHKQQIADDFASPKSVASILPLVTEPQYRAALVDFGEVLAWADDEVSVDEEAIIKSLRAGAMGSVDLARLRADVVRARTDAGVAHDAEMKAARRVGSPVLRALDRVLGKLGVSLLD